MRDLTLEPEVQAPRMTGVKIVAVLGDPNKVRSAWSYFDDTVLRVTFCDGTVVDFPAAGLRKLAEGAS